MRNGALSFVRIKICCMGSVEEAHLAIREGADAVGLVSEMPTGRGVIRDELIKEIAQAIPPGVTSVLLTSRTDPDTIIEHQRETGVHAIQVVDRVPPDDLLRVRRSLPGIGLIRVVHVVDEGSIAEAASCVPAVDALLLDSGIPEGPGRTLGGTGRVHDWCLSKRIVEEVPRPVFLAGGLTPRNVGSAVRQVRPFGVDVCSGLRPHGALDPTLLREFIAAAREAENQ